jgi:hypothetical protein
MGIKGQFFDRMTSISVFKGKGGEVGAKSLR